MMNTGITENRRIFIGMALPAEIRNKIHDFSFKIFEGMQETRVIPPRNLHITLKFLGNTPVSKIDKIKKAIKEASGYSGAFMLEITGVLVAFPDTGKARVAFIETGKGSSDISGLYNCLEYSLSRIKIGKEKRAFSPHITVARFRNITDIRKMVSEKRMEPTVTVECSRIVLYESILKPEGSEYVNLENFILK